MNTTFIENLNDVYDIDANKIIDELLKIDYNVIFNDLRDPRVIYIIPRMLYEDNILLKNMFYKTISIYIKKIIDLIF